MRQSLLFSHVLPNAIKKEKWGDRKNINIQTTDHLMPANPDRQRSYRTTLDYEIRMWSAGHVTTRKALNVSHVRDSKGEYYL